MFYQQLSNEGQESREEDPWDVFVVDEDEYDPDPEHGDFWPDDDFTFTDVDGSADRPQDFQREVLLCSL
jgi:hypothetical protein